MANNVAYALETVISGGVKIKNKVGMEKTFMMIHTVLLNRRSLECVFRNGARLGVIVFTGIATGGE